MTARLRRGYTLLEVTIVFAVLAVTALVVVPQWLRAGEDPERTAERSLTALLRDARALAIGARQVVSVHLNVEDGTFRVDTTGPDGSGAFTDGTLDLGAAESLRAGGARVHYRFSPTGAATADSLIVRRGSTETLVRVDRWSGEVVTHAR